MRTICHTAYRTSIAIAQEKGPFPFLQMDAYLASPFIQRLPEDIRADIARHGIRNSHLLAIAPAGTISLLADNISSGIEPVFDFIHQRLMKNRLGEAARYALTDQALNYWRERYGDAVLPDYFVTAADLSPDQHLNMQAALQPFVDNAVSKTVNVPASINFETFSSVYITAWRLGLKGCTTFRPNPHTGAILTAETQEEAKCCAGPSPDD
jgi:ribonucleoside-diphosphate reductase alpha chain